MKKEPNFRERAQYLISPRWGQRAYAARLKREQENQAVRQSATGYGNHGASTTLNSLVGWIVGEGSAEDDIDLQGATLRKRSRDLYAGGGLAKSGVETMVTNVAGWGIQPKPEIDGEALGLSDEECDAWERQALREWRLWAENTMCDAEHSKTFYAMQQLAFRSQLMSGDCFALFGMEENRRTPYRLTIRILEADRVSTPDTSGDSESVDTDGGGRIVDGVEINAAGQVVRYHITNRHPLAETDMRSLEWVAVDAFGKDTGYPNILHVTGFERPEQRRGIPFVAAQIEQIKQLDRYLNSELAANVVSSMLTAFIISSEDDGRPGMEDAVNEDEKVTDDEFKIELAPGAIYDLPPGKTIKEINPLRNNAGFESFVNALIMIVGASMGVPKEVLIKKFDSNYTAARAALLDFWKRVKVERAGFNASFNQPVYEQWLSEAVATGRLEAPGFFDDPAIRRAWCGCQWIGCSMGHVDPLKEVKAAGERIALHISTEEQEAGEYNGGDWNANMRQRKRELAMAAAMGETIQWTPTDWNEDDDSGDKSDKEGKK